MWLDRRLFIAAFGACGLVLTLFIVGYYISTIEGCGKYYDYLRSLAPEIGAAGIGGIVIGGGIAITVDQFASFKRWQAQRDRLIRMRRSKRSPNMLSELKRNGRNVDFTGFKFSDETIEECKIVRARFGNVGNATFSAISIIGCSFFATDFGAPGRRATLEDVNFSGSEFSRCRFLEVTITAAAPDPEAYRSALFRQCRFLNVRFENQNLELATIEHSIFWGSHFANIRLPGDLLDTFEKRGWARRGNEAGTWQILPFSEIVFSRGQTNRLLAIWSTIRAIVR